ncbi:MAG: hypothetical protein Q8R02_07140 [Hyphomonadaceae bacterium]|nr:hypothetical protein [Hyphomonadaceae bacterium]
MKHSTSLAAGIVAVVAFGVSAAAVAEQHNPAPTQQAVTKNLQGHAPPSADDPFIRTFYDALVAARARGADKVDAPLETQLRQTASERAPLHPEMNQKVWADHVVDMGRQMLEIGKKDPKVFDSYQSFAVALGGPQ